MRGSKVPQQRRAKAVGLALVKGVPAAARETGESQRNIRRWKHDPELAELILSAREDVGEAFWIAIQVGLGEVYLGLRNPAEPLRSKSEAVAMLVEKRALLMGEATGRQEVRTLTDGLNDDEKRKLRDWIDRLELTEDVTSSAVPDRAAE